MFDIIINKRPFLIIPGNCQVGGTEHQEKDRDKKEHRKKHRHSSSKHHKHSSPRQQSDSEDDTAERRNKKTVKRSTSDHKHRKAHSDSEYDSSEGERKKKKHDEDRKYKEKFPSHHSRKSVKERNQDTDDRYYGKSNSERYASEGHTNGDVSKRGRDSERENRNFPNCSSDRSSHLKHRNAVPKLSEEERAAKLRQMQLAAELHEEQRWKRLKKAEENDAKEVIQSKSSGGRNFLDAAHKSVYGAGEGGSASIAESVRRRTHYSQGTSEAGEGNAFRR